MEKYVIEVELELREVYALVRMLRDSRPKELDRFYNQLEAIPVAAFRESLI